MKGTSKTVQSKSAFDLGLINLNSYVSRHRDVWLLYWTAQVVYATERVHADDQCWEHAGQAVVSPTPTPWGTSEPLSCDGFVSHLPRLPVIPTQRHHLRADSQPEPHLLSALARGCIGPEEEGYFNPQEEEFLFQLVGPIF